MIFLAVVLGFIVLVVVAVIGMYNALVGLRNQVKNAWSQIDVQLKRRHDLIPNLIETAKGYMKHEQTLLENVTKARAEAVQATGVRSQAKAEDSLSQNLRSLFAVFENYPDLKANQNMLAVQEELSSTENKISFARQHYNDEVMSYNTGIESIPTNVLAGLFHFGKEEFFELEDASERKNVKVSFS